MSNPEHIPEGAGRDSPGGEEIWRAWWDEAQRLCGRCHDVLPEARAFLARTEETSHE